MSLRVKAIFGIVGGLLLLLVVFTIISMHQARVGQQELDNTYTDTTNPVGFVPSHSWCDALEQVRQSGSWGVNSVVADENKTDWHICWDKGFLS